MIKRTNSVCRTVKELQKVGGELQGVMFEQELAASPAAGCPLQCPAEETSHRMHPAVTPPHLHLGKELHAQARIIQYPGLLSYNLR